MAALRLVDEGRIDLDAAGAFTLSASGQEPIALTRTGRSAFSATNLDMDLKIVDAADPPGAVGSGRLVLPQGGRDFSLERV
jgi:hypothetical protein